jgi:hypothetical protein
MRGPLTYAVLGIVCVALAVLLGYLVWKGHTSDAVGVAVALLAAIVNLVLGKRLERCGPRWCCGRRRRQVVP